MIWDYQEILRYPEYSPLSVIRLSVVLRGQPNLIYLFAMKH